MTGCSGNDKDGSKETQTTEAGSAAGTEDGSEAGTDGSEVGTEGSTEAEILCGVRLCETRPI